MSKHHNKPNTQPETKAPMETVAVTTEPEVVVVNDETSLSVTAQDSVTDEFVGRKYLEVLPQEYHPAIQDLSNPDFNDFNTASQALDVRSKEGFRTWVEKNYTRKIGYHVATTDFRIPTLSLDQGKGKEDKKPVNSKAGCSYDSDGNLVTAPGQSALALGVVERIYGAVVGIHETRILWAPKDESGEPIPMPGLKGGPPQKNQPLCTSMDRKVGSRFGDCERCNFRPNSPSVQWRSQCKDNTDVYVMRMDPNGDIKPFSSLYKLTMSTASNATGVKPIRTRIEGGWNTMWDRLFVFETLSVTKGINTYQVWKSAVAVDRDNPAGIPTSPAARKVLELFARKIESAVYFPSLATAYSRSKAVEAGGEENVANLDDVNKALDQDPASNL
jgi:hypothetical protein